MKIDAGKPSGKQERPNEDVRRHIATVYYQLSTYFDEYRALSDEYALVSSSARETQKRVRLLEAASREF